MADKKDKKTVDKNQLADKAGLADKPTSAAEDSGVEMKVITVIPIDRGIFKDELSYFSKVSIYPGSIVSIPVKNRQIKALVIAERRLNSIKAEIKSQSFALKKLTGKSLTGFLAPEFIEAALIAGPYFAATIGQVIKTFVPKIILDNFKTKNHQSAGLNSKNNQATLPDIFILQEPDKERYIYYRGLIRESFAKNQSLFFCLPTIPDIEKILPYLEKGIAAYLIILHSGLTKKEMLERWSRAVELKHPVVIIATPLFLSLPRADLSTLIIDRENSPVYKGISRPFIDARTFAKSYAKIKHLKLIFGDTVLRTETIFCQGKGEFMPLSPLKYRAFSTARQTLVDLTDSNQTVKNTISLSAELIQSIDRALKNNERFFIFTARRGMAGLTICRDCGLILNCDHCQSSLVIHQINSSQKIYLCHKCGQTYQIKDTCPNCRGWRLEILASGIEKVAEEIKKLFPATKLFKITSDHIKSGQKAKAVTLKFLNSPGSILLGTEMSLYYLTEPVENAAVVSIDSVLAIPDFRINEKVFNLLIRVREMAAKNFIIQTRQPEEKVFDYCLKGNLLDFFREELAERKIYGYPPFSVLLKITQTVKSDNLETSRQRLSQVLEKFKPIIYPALVGRIKNKFIINALIKQDPTDWPNDNLVSRLKSLPPEFTVIVDPEEIL